MMNDAMQQATMKKVTRRLLPILMLAFFIAFLDRVNVGVAALQLNEDLGFSAAAYGFGAGLFFIGYFLFEVPSNLILYRVGARRWLARIMITWGIIAAAMMFVTNEFTFYLLRFLLGTAEAGFYPGVILYLTYWFPSHERVRAIGVFQSTVAACLIFGTPLSGALLTLDGLAGLAGWQWLFLIEGIPAVILGFVTLNYLTDTPEQADWLSVEERDWLSERMRLERERKEARRRYTLREVFSSGRVWHLATIQFCLAMSLYGVVFWLPQIVDNFTGLGVFLVSVLSALPWAVMGVALILVGRNSDRTGERRWHIAVPAFAGAVGLVLSAYLLQQPLLAILALCVAAAGIHSPVPPYWGLATAFLSGTAAAAGLALVNSVANIGGFVGPYLVGLITDATGSQQGGLLVMALVIFAGGVLALAIPRAQETVERTEDVVAEEPARFGS